MTTPRSAVRTRTRAGLAVLVALAAALAVTLAWPARAQGPLVVRMATLVPDGSSWYQILKESAERWKQASGGRVSVRLFPGGVAGDDPDVVRKMMLGKLEAGVLTALGVAEIDKSVHALDAPLLYDSYDEADWVQERMRPTLERGLEAKGFVALNWVDGGWVHFFAKKPVKAPDDLRKLKLFSWAGDAEWAGAWRSAGFDPVPLPATEISSALQTGRLEALAAPTQIALISQLFAHAPNMTSLRWQLLQGATLVAKATWDEVPAELRPQLLEIARDAGARLRKDVRDAEARDVEAMKKRGLDVVAVSASQRAEWQKLALSFYPKIRGRIVPAEAFDEAMRYRDEYRKSHPLAAGER